MPLFLEKNAGLTSRSWMVNSKIRCSKWEVEERQLVVGRDSRNEGVMRCAPCETRRGKGEPPEGHAVSESAGGTRKTISMAAWHHDSLHGYP